MDRCPAQHLASCCDERRVLPGAVRQSLALYATPGLVLPRTLPMPPDPACWDAALRTSIVHLAHPYALAPFLRSAIELECLDMLLCIFYPNGSASYVF